MIKRSLLLAAFGLTTALACGGPQAVAQIAPSRSGSSTMSYLDSSEVWPILNAYGSCYATQNKADAFVLLATEPGSVEEARTYKKLFSKPYQSCLGNVVQLNISHTMVRGAIAEGLYRKGVVIPASLVIAPPAQGAKIKNLAEAARCYAASHRSEVKSLITTTKVATKEEAAAVDALMPDFTKCIPSGARRISVASTQVRYRLAEALLRLPPETTASAGKN